VTIETTTSAIDCYFCPKLIEAGKNYVKWFKCCKDHSYEEHIALHPKCATMLGRRLIEDAYVADPQVEQPQDTLMLVENSINRC
jgi:hypothetical protein